jgi:hypothetical protein
VPNKGIVGERGFAVACLKVHQIQKGIQAEEQGQRKQQKGGSPGNICRKKHNREQKEKREDGRKAAKQQRLQPLRRMRERERIHR